MHPMSTTYPDGRALLTTMLRDERKSLSLASLLLTFWSAGEALVPAVIGATIDEAIAATDVKLLGIWLTVLGLCFAMLSFGYRFGSRIANQALNRQAHRLRGLVAEHVLDLRRTGVPDRMPGEVATAASSDSDVASSVIRQAVLGVASVCGLLVCAAYLLWVNLWVGSAVLVIVPAALWFLRWLTPRLSRSTAQLQADIAAAGASAADLMAGVEVLRGIGGQPIANDWYAEHSRSATAAGVRAASANGRLDGARVLVAGLVLLVVAALSTGQVLAGNMSVGAMVGVLGVASFLTQPLGMIVMFVGAYSRSRAAADRIADLLNASVWHDGRAHPEPSAQSSVTMRLNEVTINCPPGTFSVVVCADPQLQDRLIQILEHPEPECVYIGEHDVTEIAAERLPEIVRIAPHEAWMLEGDVALNIFGHRATADNHVNQRLLDASGVGQLLDEFSDGLAHRVESAGHNLSGGQRQRISLARALAGGPLARILMDPTNAVDSITESAIADGIRALHDAEDLGTLVVVSASPNLLNAAEKVVFVSSDGGVTYATHEDLAARPEYMHVVTR